MRHRIIPVILRDVDKEVIDRNLRNIMETITYLQWPGENTGGHEEKHFWDQLKLSMPKTRKSCEGQHEGSGTTNAPMSDVAVSGEAGNTIELTKV